MLLFQQQSEKKISNTGYDLYHARTMVILHSAVQFVTAKWILSFCLAKLLSYITCTVGWSIKQW